MTPVVIAGQSFVALLESMVDGRHDIPYNLDLHTCNVQFVSKRGGYIQSLRHMSQSLFVIIQKSFFFHIGENYMSGESRQAHPPHSWSLQQQQPDRKNCMVIDFA